MLFWNDLHGDSTRWNFAAHEKNGTKGWKMLQRHRFDRRRRKAAVNHGNRCASKLQVNSVTSWETEAKFQRMLPM
jgi:hypothetical protein